MLRHVIAPVRFFSQVSNEIIRHPRLSSDAVRLLTWQLSLPQEADEPLSRTAQRAGIKKVAFIRAKQQLKAEGYVHEWRQQDERGRWVTRQLVSSVPLSAEEAAQVRDGDRDLAPTGGVPAAGEPTGRAVGRHPLNTPEENTSHQPEPGGDACRAVADLHLVDERLRVPRGMLQQLAALAAQWLAGGHTVEDVRTAVRQGLPAPGLRIHRPGGLVRHLLREVPPPPAPPAEVPTPRVALMRECAGSHTQPRLFRPVTDETHCGECRQTRAESPLRAPVGKALVALRGAAAARAAMRG
ncbi:hypothetical protein NLX86_32800 [Streptomyces sp. A3M-1-3]|uniref:hypothetical protein n=1 Tax=Streptomyces sp. A3M-1-3 TaxID=2962044 RepID=UPI0020B86B5C|nr:hypothetical protein [Streptomyces sp. A3M-1-3]MCP3822695.1 hypothetical protein [Streptomyces sp. A3M-1-3]